MRKPNLKSLRMFDASARHLNFRRAAEELNVTQGAVAQQVRQLEADLGIKLFRRVARGLTLTEAGNDYHRSIKHALSIIDEATRKLRPETAGITVSVTPSFAAKWLVPRLPRLAELHPEIEVQTIASEEVANFRTDNVDLAIRQGRAPFGEGLHVELLAPLDLCAVCSAVYMHGKDAIRRFEDFAEHRLIQDSHTLWKELFEPTGTALTRKLMQFNQTALAMDAAINGQGIALVPRLLLDFELSKGRLVCLWHDKRFEQDGYYIVYPENGERRLEALQKVTDWLISEITTQGLSNAECPCNRL